MKKDDYCTTFRIAWCLLKLQYLQMKNAYTMRSGLLDKIIGTLILAAAFPLSIVIGFGTAITWMQMPEDDSRLFAWLMQWIGLVAFRSFGMLANGAAERVYGREFRHLPVSRRDLWLAGFFSELLNLSTAFIMPMIIGAHVSLFLINGNFVTTTSLAIFMVVTVIGFALPATILLKRIFNLTHKVAKGCQSLFPHPQHCLNLFRRLFGTSVFTFCLQALFLSKWRSLGLFSVVFVSLQVLFFGFIFSASSAMYTDLFSEHGFEFDLERHILSLSLLIILLLVQEFIGQTLSAHGCSGIKALVMSPIKKHYILFGDNAAVMIIYLCCTAIFMPLFLGLFGLQFLLSAGITLMYIPLAAIVYLTIGNYMIVKQPLVYVCDIMRPSMARKLLSKARNLLIGSGYIAFVYLFPVETIYSVMTAAILYTFSLIVYIQSTVLLAYCWDLDTEGFDNSVGETPC